VYLFNFLSYNLKGESSQEERRRREENGERKRKGILQTQPFVSHSGTHHIEFHY
jgi:hypothetical protein